MLAGMRQVVQCKLQPGQLNCAPPSRRWCHRAAPTRHQRATGVITSPHTRQRSERTNDIAHAPFWRWRKSAFFKVLIKIKYISIKTLDRNQVHFKPVNQKLSKAVPPQVPPRTWQGTQGGLRRAWLRRTRDEGGTTNAASESSAGEVVAPA